MCQAVYTVFLLVFDNTWLWNKAKRNHVPHSCSASHLPPIVLNQGRLLAPPCVLIEICRREKSWLNKVRLLEHLFNCNYSLFLAQQSYLKLTVWIKKPTTRNRLSLTLELLILSIFFQIGTSTPRGSRLETLARPQSCHSCLTNEKRAIASPLVPPTYCQKYFARAASRGLRGTLNSAREQK